MTERLGIATCGASVLVTAEPGSGVCARLAARLPPDAVAHLLDAPTVRYDVVGGPASSRRDQVTRDGWPCFEAPTTGEVAARLRSLVDVDLAVHARDGLAVHAGAVAWRGQGILLPGRSMTGKSTLVTELVRRGATYYSDELAVLDDEGRLHPCARPLCLRDGRPGGDRWVAPEALGVVGRTPVLVALVVSTAYRPDAMWKPALITGARAAMPLVDNAVLGREDPRRALRVAAARAPTLLTLQGRGPDAASVAPATLDLADAVADRREGVRPPRFLRVENFLVPDELRRLLDFAVAREADYAPSGVDPGPGARVDPAYRRSRTIYDLEPVWDLFAPRLAPLLPLLRAELGIPFPPRAAGVRGRRAVPLQHADAPGRGHGGPAARAPGAPEPQHPVLPERRVPRGPAGAWRLAGAGRWPLRGDDLDPRGGPAGAARGRARVERRLHPAR